VAPTIMRLAPPSIVIDTGAPAPFIVLDLGAADA
jgi:hypothetical protein